MPVLYAAPFILLSTICFLTCLAIPKMRRYALEIGVAPIAFGFCSITGMFAIVLISDFVGLHLAIVENPPTGIGQFIAILLLYIAPGLLGASVTVALIGWLRIKASLRRQATSARDGDSTEA